VVVDGKYGHAPSLFRGRCKTANLFEKCIHSLGNDPTIDSDQDMFAKSDSFINTMKKTIVKPGNWHAGLTMLQSIMNTFWDGFLEPLVSKLGWKCVQQDFWDCYFQALQCVWYVDHKLLKIMMEKFVFEHMARLKTIFKIYSINQSSGNFFCYVGK
jgi:hypothetical protein